MQKYLGGIIDIIYQDRHGQFSRRRIRVLSVQDNMVRAYDFTRRAPRVFRLDSILAAFPVVRSA